MAWNAAQADEKVGVTTPWGCAKAVWDASKASARDAAVGANLCRTGRCLCFGAVERVDEVDAFSEGKFCADLIIVNRCSCAYWGA